LQEREARSLLYKCRVIKSAETSVFGMPALERADVPKSRLNLSPEQRVEAMEKEAYEKGYAAGEEAGLAMAEQKAGVLLERLEAVIREMTEFKDNTLKALEPQLVRLATAVARKVLGQELAARPEAIVNMVKEAMTRLERTGPITIKLNPALYDLMVKTRPELLEVHPEIVFDVDPSASSTGPLVIGPEEEVVTDAEEQIKNMVEEMDVEPH
jgi:hypothetical protein